MPRSKSRSKSRPSGKGPANGPAAPASAAVSTASAAAPTASAAAAAAAVERGVTAPVPAAAQNSRMVDLQRAEAKPNGEASPAGGPSAADAKPNGRAHPAGAGSPRSWEQCRPEAIKHTVTGKRVIKAAEYWNRGQAKLRADDETCVDDFGKAIHLDILGASFFAELVPRKDGGIGEKLQEYLRRAIDNKDTAREGKGKAVFPLITRAYITFLLTATPQLRGVIDTKDGSRIVRASADMAVAADPDDPRLRIIRAGFLSQLGGPRASSIVSVDARSALELASAQIKTIMEDPNSYVGGRVVKPFKSEVEGKPIGKGKGAAGKKKTQGSKVESNTELTPEAAEKIAWLRLQKAHANLQLGDLHWNLKKSKAERHLAENYLREYIKDSTECDPDMHGACYKLAILLAWNIANPKKVNIAPNLVRANPEKIQPVFEWYNRGVAAQELHHTWLPSGMDEQAGPIARTWLKVIKRSFAQEPAIKPNPLTPHPGLKCENPECPNNGKTPPGEKCGMCGSCLWANYCCKACQLADWKVHKKNACVEARGIAAITADGDFLKQ